MKRFITWIRSIFDPPRTHTHCGCGDTLVGDEQKLGVCFSCWAW